MIKTRPIPFDLITATTCQATARTSRFERKNYEVCTIEYVISGGGFLELNGRPPEYAGPDSVYFLPKHSDHVYYPDRDDPWRKHFFVVDGELMENLMAAYGLSEGGVMEHAESLKHFFTEFIQLAKRGRRTAGGAALLFHEFLENCGMLLMRQQQPVPDTADLLRTALGKDLSGKFILKEYARDAGMSCEHLIRIFGQRFGITPQAFRLKIRLEEASRLLRWSDLSIKEIAAMVGFADQYSFSNRFKQYSRASPSDFRRQYRNEVVAPSEAGGNSFARNGHSGNL